MYRGYYRREKGFEGRIYRVQVPERDVRGLVASVLIISAAISLLLCTAAFFAGLSVR